MESVAALVEICHHYIGHSPSESGSDHNCRGGCEAVERIALHVAEEGP